MSNVGFCGAVGDGKQDDTSAIRHALEEGDGLLEFPRGDYRITETIEIDLDQRGRTGLIGLGGTARIIMAGSGPAFRFLGTHAGTASPQSFQPNVWQRQRMPRVEGLEIIGDHAEADGLELTGVVQPTITGVLLRELRHGIVLRGRARNVIIQACHIFHNTGVGIFLDQVNLHQTNIVGCHVSYCRLGGIRIENSEIRNLQITGNDIEYNNNASHRIPDADAEPTAEIYIDAGEESIREVTISGNTIQATASPGGANIRLIGDPQRGNHKIGMATINGNLIGSQTTNLHFSWCRGITVSGNHIYSGHDRNVVADHCRNLNFSGNVFGHNPDYGDAELTTGLRFHQCRFCNLTGDLIEDAGTGENTVAGAERYPREGLVELSQCREIAVTGLQLIDPTPIGLLIRDSHGVDVSGCRVVDTREPPKMQEAIATHGDCRRIRVDGRGQAD